jgi:hypothetical protein
VSIRERYYRALHTTLYKLRKLIERWELWAEIKSFPADKNDDHVDAVTKDK